MDSMDLDMDMDVDVDLVPDEPIAPEFATEEAAVGELLATPSCFVLTTMKSVSFLQGHLANLVNLGRASDLTEKSPRSPMCWLLLRFTSEVSTL